MATTTTTPVTTVFIVFQIYGEGDGYTTFSMKRIFSSFQMAVTYAEERAKTLNVSQPISASTYSKLPEHIRKDFDSQRYTVSSRSAFKDACYSFGYCRPQALLIELYVLDDNTAEEDE